MWRQALNQREENIVEPPALRYQVSVIVVKHDGSIMPPYLNIQHCQIQGAENTRQYKYKPPVCDKAFTVQKDSYLM